MLISSRLVAQDSACLSVTYSNYDFKLNRVYSLSFKTPSKPWLYLTEAPLHLHARCTCSLHSRLHGAGVRDPLPGGVLRLCATLSDHGVDIGPSTQDEDQPNSQTCDSIRLLHTLDES